MVREKESSTGLEDRFAIPHARTNSIIKPSILFIKFKQGIDWTSLDKKLTHYAFVLLIPKNVSSIHLDILSKISSALMDQDFIKKIKETEPKDVLYKEINKFLENKEEINNNLNNNSNRKKVIT